MHVLTHLFPNIVISIVAYDVLVYNQVELEVQIPSWYRILYSTSSWLQSFWSFAEVHSFEPSKIYLGIFGLVKEVLLSNSLFSYDS